MQTSTKVLIGAGVAAAGVGGFVGFRLFVRSKARESLVDKYNFDTVFVGLETAEKLSGKDWNLPTFEEFLEAITPVWSVTMPADAIDDVIAKGRESDFWPEKYRAPANADTERYIFAALRGASESSGGFISEIISAAAQGIAAEAAKAKSK